MSGTAVSAYTLTSAAGTGLDALRAALRNRTSGLRQNDFPASTVETWIGRVTDLDESAPELPPEWNSRNNSLAALGLEQDGFLDAVAAVVRQYGPERVGTIIGTSTSSIGHTEDGYRRLADERMPPEYRQPLVHHPHSPGAWVAERCGLEGPALTISTACASSARVFSSAHRWLQAGFVDAVVVGGVDTLCHTVINGFNSLELTSVQPCQPFDTDRNGINLGEAAGFALLTRAESDIHLAGYGEFSDAWHMSHPHPEGEGARSSMAAALQRAGLTAADIGYVNLHGTATRANDASEAQAMANVFPADTFASSTKGWTGHALGAAGIVESVIAMDSMVTGLLPGTLNLALPDESLAFQPQMDNGSGPIRAVLTNSFGFGGNNCSLVFSHS